MRGKTINIYIPDGNPRSVKVCEIQNKIVTALFIPRNKLKEFSDRNELKKPGIYFLIGSDNESSMSEVYIGESEILLDRLKNHNINKDFWKYLICFTSEKNNLNKAHIKYLESIAIELATKVNKCILLQGRASNKPSMTDSDRDFVLDFFDDIKILISSLGYPIFDEVTKEKSEIFICEGRGAKGIGEYSPDGFILYDGANISKDITNGSNNNVIRLRKELIENKIIIENKLVKNYTFSSPSQASSFILGRSSNGWKDWKNSKGKTLDEIYRGNK